MTRPHWETAWLWRGVLVTLVTGLATINGVGVFSQLVEPLMFIEQR